MMSEDFANRPVKSWYKNDLLQPFPRQPYWPTLSPQQQLNRLKLCVNINKTVDANLSDLLPKITGKYFNRAELLTAMESHKLVVFLFSGPFYDLCDFEV